MKCILFWSKLEPFSGERSFISEPRDAASANAAPGVFMAASVYSCRDAWDALNTKSTSVVNF